MRQADKDAITEECIRPAIDIRRTTDGLTGSEWLVLLALAAVQFTHVVDFIIIMPLGPELKSTLRLNPQQFSLIVAAYGFSASLTGLFAALFVDRFDRKTAILGLYAGFTVGTLFCALAQNYVLLLAARAVAGAFGGVVGASILTILGDAFPDARRGRATGVVMSAFSVASIVGVPAGLYLAAILGWRAPFSALTGLSAIVLIAIYLILPSMRGHLGRSPAELVNPLTVLIRVLNQLIHVLIQPTHLRAYLLMMALMLSSFLIAPFLADFLVANVGVRKDQLPYVYLCGGLATLLTMTLFGWLSDRFGKLPVFRVLALLTLAPIGIITNLPPTPLAAVLTISTLFWIVSSGRMVPAMALITASAAPSYRGSFLSVNGSVQTMTMGLASVLGGALIGEAEDGRLIGYPLAGLLSMVAVLASVWLAGRLRPAAGGLQAADVIEPPARDEAEAVCSAAAE
jgi:predicted MFS family arabinose efflux permease